MGFKACSGGVGRACDADQKLAAGGGGGGDGAPDAEAIEESMKALDDADLLPTLEASISAPPSQETALLAHACLARVTEAFLAGSVEHLPRPRALSAILGGLKMGLGGQGGLFIMACLPLPFVLTGVGRRCATRAEAWAAARRVRVDSRGH